GVLASLAVVGLIAHSIELSVVALTIVTMIGLGVGIDYSLLIVTRFREELSAGHSPAAAVARTVRTAGGAVAISGTTVILGYAVLPIRIGLPARDWWPAGTEAGQGAMTLERMGLGGVIQPIHVVVELPPGQRFGSARALRGLRVLSDSLKADPRIAGVKSI